MSKVRGAFPDFSGSIDIADKLADSQVTAEVQMASVTTHNAERDAHLRSAEIFDVEHFPTMRFRGTGVRMDGDSQLLDGELTIRNVIRPVTLKVEYNGVGEDPWGGVRAGFTATTSIHRNDFGIDFNIPLQGDKLLLGDKIDIELEIEAVRQ